MQLASCAFVTTCHNNTSLHPSCSDATPSFTALYHRITMEMPATASVLVIRSLCLAPAETFQSNADGDRHNAVDSTYSNRDEATKRMMKRTLDELPLWCDITVIPEIPVDTHIPTMHEDSVSGSIPLERASLSRRAQPDIRMKQQALNPCGMDNVLLLRDLPPAADPASYLLSLTSCETVLTHVETPDGVIDMDPVTVSVHASPSTFSFAFDSITSSVQSLDRDNVVVNPRSASAELNVNFDFTMALDHLEAVWSEDTEDLALKQNAIGTKENPSRDGPLVEEIGEHFSPLKERPDAALRATDHHDELLSVLRELAEKEARDLDWMLAALALIFILLLALYVRTVLPLIRANKASVKRKVMTRSEYRSKNLETVPTNPKEGTTRADCIRRYPSSQRIGSARC